MKNAIGIFSEIKNLGSDKEKREELKEYCQQNIEQILQHLPQRILMSDGGCLLEYIFLGLPDKMKSKVVDKVLHKIRIEPVSITHCGDIISRVCSELPRLPVEDLVRWSSDSVQTIVDDVDVNMIWKDILPECLYTILSHDTIKHCGTEISGEEFKIQLVHTLCQCHCTERQLVPLCTMFKGMQLPRAELKQVVNKLCSYVVDLPPDALPPVVHQLLKLCKVEHMEIVLSHLSNYFNLKLYSTLKPAQQDSESTTIDVDDIAEHSTKELSQCLLTCLYHFTQGAADAEVIRKHIKKWPKLQLLASPFLINLALAVSDKGRMIRTVCLDAIKSAIEFHIMDGLRRKESAWVRCSELPDIDVSRLLKILTTESTDLRQFTVLGLINLAFSLLSVSRVKPTAQACWSHGKLILVRLSKGQPETAGHILTELADRLLGEPQQQYSDCLHVLCKLTPVSIERCHTQLSTILESCQPVGDYTHAARTYAAVRPLVGFSARVRDCLVMVSRKGLYSRDSLYRCLALSGFLTVLREMKLSSKTPLARSQNSDQYSATSYLTQLTVDFHSTNQGIGLTSRTRKETICLEVISILRRCLVQDAAVKKVLYRELYECTKDKVVLHERILELLYEQLVKYLPDEDNEKPLLLDKCVQTTATGAVLVEPIGHLLFAIAQFLQPTEEEDLEDILQSPSDDGAAILRNKLTDVLEKLCGSDLLSLVDMEEPGLTDLTPESRAKCLKVQQLMQCLEALVAHRVMQWSLHNSLARSAYALYRAHNQLMDTTKGSPKVGRKNKTLNETGETSKSQKSQKDAKGKGKGKGKGKSATTVANLVKDRAAPFKALPCLWDTQFSLRILELLYSETIIWSTTQQRNDIRGKRDFHLFALRCVQAAVPEHVTKQTVSTHILNIATLVYKRCVCRFQDMSDFDEHTTYACLELFKACLTLVLSPKYSLKTESVLKGITGTVKQEAPESECLAEIIEKLHAALRKLESEAADDDLDLIGKKTFNMLVQITTVLLETPVLACDALNRTIVKLEEYLRDSKQPEILPMLSPLLTAAHREQQEATLLVDVLTDLTAALGVIDEESSSTDAQTHFPTINSTTGHTALSLVCTHLNSRFKCIEHSLHRARDLTEAVGIAVESHQSRLERERRELYKSIVLQLCQLTGWSCSAAKLRCNVGADSERVLGVCVRMFSILASMIKTLDADMAEFVRPELEKLLKFTGKKLSPSTDGLITYVAEAADEGETASKVLRRTKLNPRLVLEREQFCKHVILFGNKVKINFQQYLPEGPARDFKIKVKNSPQLLQDQANADDENDVSINDAETVILSGGSDNENHDSASDSDAEPSASKRRRLS